MSLTHRLSRSLTALLGGVALVLASTVAAAQDLEVHFLNVGQGNAALIVGPDGTTVLFDGGPPGRGTSTVRPYMQGLGLGHLDYSVMSHWHTDHMGGMDEVFTQGFKPLIAAYDRGDFMRPSNGEVSGYLSAVATPVGLRQQPTVGQTIALGNGATLQFTSENGNHIGGGFVNPFCCNQSENGSSVTCVVRYGDFDLWLSGDLTGGGSGTANVEGPVALSVGQVEVLLSGHHGSNTSSNTTAVASFNPSFVVHSNGLDNPFGHPTAAVTSRWNPNGFSRVQWSTTDGDTGNGAGGFFGVNGHIKVSSDGNTFDIERAGGTERVNFTTFEQPGTLAGLGDLAITELLVNPQGAQDIYGEWFEVYNRSESVLNLGGMRFVNGAETLTIGSQIILSPSERTVIAVDGRQSRNGQVFPGLCAPFGNLHLNDTAGTLEMKTQSLATIESVTWGPGGFQPLSGISAERIDPDAVPVPSNFADAVTTWAGFDLGTPGEVNDNEGQLCETPVNFCTPVPNSTGQPGIMDWSGTVDITQNNLVLIANQLPPSVNGLFIYSPDQVEVPLGNGTLCLGNQTLGFVLRLPPHTTNGAGIMTHNMDLTDPPAPGGLVTAGTTWYFQCWHRDAGGAFFNFSDGLEITFCASDPIIQPGDMVVTEFMSDPAAVADADGEWIEFYNSSPFAIDLEGWTLRDAAADSHVISNGGPLVVAAGDRIVLGSNGNMGTNGNVPVDYVWSNFQLDADDEIILEAPDTTLVDDVSYLSFFWPILTGRSATLDPGSLDHVSNDNTSNWCGSQSTIPGGSDFGTPGAANENCP